MLRTMTISFVGLTALACAAVADTAIPVANPWVSPSSYAISHHNPGQTDSTPVDGPRIGKDLTLAEPTGCRRACPAMAWCTSPTSAATAMNTWRRLGNR